jgi:acetyltransferase-like isoleucine patch superfamily enzyme
MSVFNKLYIRVARAETPVFRLAKRILRTLFNPTLPALPRALIAPLRLIYEVHFAVITVFRGLRVLLYCNPLFQARCAAFGSSVKIEGLPYVNGPVEIHIGDDVRMGGGVNILSSGLLDAPQFILKDRSAVGWNTTISVSREVLIEEDVIVSYDCHISDGDGHPREADRRAAGKAPAPEDVRPVRICRYAWIGNGSYVMKGVTIGEGAVISANSVVISNIPPYSLAMGNPAEILMKNYGRPRKVSANPVVKRP